ncbi:MAG: glycosyl hydrolase family 18 protein [Bacteroidota bacterium]
MKKNILILLLLLPLYAISQHNESIHQEQLNHYNSLGFDDASFNQVNKPAAMPSRSVNASCNLNKIVFGWHPYWQNGFEDNYDWDLISDFSYFCYEVDYLTGNATSTHSWATNDAVDTALARGKRVNLAVTLFGNHATFLTNATSKQTLISNLISLVQTRGAHGVNIDFEGVPSAQKANMTSFMIDLCTQMHVAIPGSQISIDLPSVEWSSTYDVAAMGPYVDLFIIMGYDYYYSGSTTAGPTDPLYNFQTGYNYTLTKSITYYLNLGVAPSKLILGLPYYGKEWPTASNAVPSTCTAGYSVFWNTVRANASGDYTTKLWNQTSFTPYYAFQDGTQWYQCWMDDAYSLGRRYDMVNQRGIGGIGIWALGYDDGYTELWDKLRDKFTNCGTTPCSDSLYDMGGPQRNYYDNESYTYTISPTNSSFVSMLFSNFSLGAGDTLKIYNGASIASPLVGSYTGTNNPGNINASGNALTLRFKSNAATNGTGWKALWSCIYDNIPPTTAISAGTNWKTQNFTATFADVDNVGGSGLEKSFYQVSDFNNTEWRANNTRGFYNDDFNTSVNPEWTQYSGVWDISGGVLNQPDTINTNTNIYSPLNQTLSNRYLYHFKAKVDGGNKTGKRFGFHFFCDSANYLNRRNSYFIWFRLETSKLEFYKVTNNTFTQVKIVDNISTNLAQWYDVKVVYDRISGKMDVYRDNVLLGSYTDPSPYSTAGNYISFRTGSSRLQIDDFRVYRSRTSNVSVNVGAASTNDLRFQNPSPASPAGRIRSIVNDAALNLSSVISADVNVDWTAPSAIASINDGTTSDLDTVFTISTISANWHPSIDTHSGIAQYLYSVSTSPGDSDIVAWTASTDTLFTQNGLSLVNGQLYYVNVKAVNGAGLVGTVTSSDGQRVIFNLTASFASSATSICEGDSVQYTNTSAFATSYQWNFPGGNTSASNLANPIVTYDSAGIYNVEMIAYGLSGSDTISLNNYLTVLPNAQSLFTVNDTVLYLPSAYAVFTNSSSSSNAYLWNFGDGNFSSDASPWHEYTAPGFYSVSLIAYSSNCKNDTLHKTDYVHVKLGAGIQSYSLDGIQVLSFHDASLIILPTTVDGAYNVSVFNVLGQEVQRFNQKGNQIRILKPAAGLFFVNISNTEKSFSIKICFE